VINVFSVKAYEESKAVIERERGRERDKKAT